MLKVDNSVLIVIDMQEKLARAMYDRDNLVKNAARIVYGAKILGVPVIWTEQNPDGLGPTLPEIREHITDSEPIIKFSFSCCGEPKFMEAVKACGRKQALVLGIECHVCVYQTIIDLKEMGYELHIISDAVSSRTLENKNIGIERVKQEGATVTSVEMALFELLKVAEGAKFKQILKVVK
ncbi:MAG: hydrolase [Deltaproteobacteria bacterium]|nr:hydrolase [Deltaproteobacteria bacterium]